jgi:hypothetical protein
MPESNYCCLYVCNFAMRERMLTRNVKLCVSPVCCSCFRYYSGNQIEKNEMGGACSTYRGKERCIQDLGGET